MKTEYEGDRAIITFNSNEGDRFEKIWKANEDNFVIEEILINNGLCIELKPKVRILC